MSAASKNDSIGGYIKSLRKERDWTQDELATKARIERTTITKYERGTLMPTPYNLSVLEKVFEVREGTLVQRLAIAVPDTSALLKNRRLLSLLLEDYNQIIIPRDVINELSALKNLKKTKRYSSFTGEEKRRTKIASHVMSLLDEYMTQNKNRITIKETRHYDVSKSQGVSEADYRIVELAKDVRKQTSRVVDIIHDDKDIPLMVDDTVNSIKLDQYMAKRFGLESDYQTLLHLDMEFDDLERYEAAASRLNLDAFLPDGMTLLISTIRCNEPEKMEKRGDDHPIPEPLIRKKIEFLLDHGADPNKPDCHNFCHTPLEHSIERFRPDFREFCLLLERGADYNKCSVDETHPDYIRNGIINEGNTPLMIACWQGREKYVKKLCEYSDLSINAQDCNGFTALIKCAFQRWDRKCKGQSCDYYEAIYTYLKDEMHADTRIRDRNNMTAEDWWNMAIEAEEDDND